MKDSRYEEALERAKQGLPIEEVFPELKESEDERVRKKLVEHISDWKEGHMRWNSNKEFCSRALAYLEKQKDEVQKQFNLGVQAGREEVMYEMEKEQKPAEWSEEDEVIWKDIFELCDRFGYNDACRKLKSLRPRPHWKPSDGQLAVLEIACKYEGVFTQGQLSMLRDLKEQLKKL